MLCSKTFTDITVGAACVAGLVRGGVQSTGAGHVLKDPSRGPALIKFFFRDTREEMLEKLRLCYVKTNVQRAK